MYEDVSLDSDIGTHRVDTGCFKTRFTHPSGSVIPSSSWMLLNSILYGEYEYPPRWMGACALTFQIYDILLNLSSEHFNPPLARDSGQIKTDTLSMSTLVHLCDNRKSGRYIFYSCHLDSPRLHPVYALYRSSRRLLVGLLSFLFVFSVGNVLLTLFTVKGITLDNDCNPHHITIIFYLARIVGFGFDTVLLALTVLGSWRHALRAKRLGGFGGSPLMYVLMRDGIWIYVSVLSIFIVSLVTSVTEAPSKILHAWYVLALDTSRPLTISIYDSIRGWILPICSSVGSHAILNLRIRSSRTGVRSSVLTSFMSEFQVAEIVTGADVDSDSNHDTEGDGVFDS
ncbi:hypothetical protein NLI96_g2195 [Meripilus lineatus]|uniref:Uncharacterized protein n=1 Tax=Meripilus lineatus TaxID=2056292 RepID=A0AAD5V969_9APHY|nr:hypothetical protein NLI96_g2195 [Physisporinus lineatus]